MSGQLADRTAIVTGGARGIGRSIARRLGEEDASVVIADIDEDAAESTAQELESEGITVEAVRCDITSVEDTEGLADAATERFGSIDVLVNNAGFGTGGTFTEIDHESWTEVVETNLTGTFNCSSAIVPEMIEDGGGSIVNIASIAGRNISYYGAANYTASKWGVIGLTKHMAWDLGEHGITVNAVCPGPTLTSRMDANRTPEEKEALEEKVPLGRWSQPEDQADAVLYLASDQGRFVNGTVLEVDGGLLLSVRGEV